MPPEQVMQWGKVKLALCESNSPLKRNLHDDRLVEAIRLIAPEWWGDRTRLCLNRNVKCERHRDGNKGTSYILFLGDFTGGVLLFDDGTRIEEKYKWHAIDGQIPHWNEPHTGCKYSVALYRRGAKRTKVDNILGVLQKIRRKKSVEDNDCDKLT